MRSGMGLCVLGLLCLHSSIFVQVAAEPSVSVLCDDPSVGLAVTSALHKFNEGMSTGHKLALFQIRKASKADAVYSLEFTSRRSDCEAGSSKPWTDCDYLSPGRKKPISCNATVSVTGTDADTQEVHCALDDHVLPERAHCMGCPKDISVDSDDLNVPLSVSISKYNTISDSTHLFTLHTVGHATRQVVAGFRYKLKFDMKKTNCAKAEHKELHGLCIGDEQDVEFSNCNSTVDTAPWRLEPPQAQIECEAGPLPPTATGFSRRRPPGWSPLRTLVVPNLNATQPLAPTKPDPTTMASQDTKKEDKKKKDDSSEEDMNDFHCPSKPWKPFRPVHHGAMAHAEEATMRPAGFSDIDLLG